MAPIILNSSVIFGSFEPFFCFVLWEDVYMLSCKDVDGEPRQNEFKLLSIYNFAVRNSDEMQYTF